MQAQEGIENLKMNRTYPTSDGLGDCKTTSRDCNTVIGLFNPAKYGIQKWEGYDIPKFGDHIRFMLVIDERDYGAAGKVCPLFFNGASSVYKELPFPNDTSGLERVYGTIREIDDPHRNDRTNILLLALGKNNVNMFGKSSLFDYLCKQFLKIFNKTKQWQ